MKWTADSKGSPVNFIGEAEGIPLSTAVRDIWLKYVQDAAPLNAELPWNYLAVHVYLDSGRVILFPVVQSARFRVEKAMCQIICPDLLASYEQMADSNLSDEAFETWATEAVLKVVSIVSQAAKELCLPEKLAKAEVKIVYFSYSGDSGPVMEETLLRLKGRE